MSRSPLPISGNTQETRPENLAFYPALDGLRAVAFLMVFCWHYFNLPWGWAGVDIFFVLSGFLITGILFDTKNDHQRIRKFYIRRTLRIFPLYYGVLFCAAFAWPLAHWNWNWKWIAWPLYLGNFLELFRAPPGSTMQYTASFVASCLWKSHRLFFAMGHFWTLCVEEQFYLVWPWLVFWLRDRKRLMMFCVVAMVGCFAARVAATALLPHWLIDQGVVTHFTVFRMDDVFAGGFISLLIRSPLRHTSLHIARLCAPIAVVLTIVWAVSRLASPLAWVSYPYPSGTATWGFTLIMVVAALVILNLIQPQTSFSRLLATRPLRWAGRLSYGAYIFHDIFHEFYARIFSCFSWPVAPLATAGLALICTYALAWLSFRFFETPFLNLKERWAKTTPRLHIRPGFPTEEGANHA